MNLEFVSLYECEDLWYIPYLLLVQREPHQNISHSRLPTLEEHCAFIRTNPYKAWFLLKTNDGIAGCIYLTHKNEVGIGILKDFRRCGIGKQAIAQLARMYPCRILANINPDNAASLALFKELGFKPLQVTYAA